MDQNAIYFEESEWQNYRKQLQLRMEEIDRSLIKGQSKWLLLLGRARGFFTQEETERMKNKDGLWTEQIENFVTDLLPHKLDRLHILIGALEDREVLQAHPASILRCILDEVRPNWEQFAESTSTQAHPVQGLIQIMRDPPADFTARVDHLKTLESKFEQYYKSIGVPPARRQAVVISGMGGVGKSSLAAQFLLLQTNHLTKCHVLWIPADTKADIRDAFVEACEKKLPGLNLRKEDGSLKSDKIIMKEIYLQLCRRKTVIIFDNAACVKEVYGMEETLEDFLCNQAQGKSHSPFYIITSRTSSPQVWKSLGDVLNIKLECFTADESWEYMSKSLNSLQVEDYEKNFKELSEFFHHLPIAIEHYVNLMNWEYKDEMDDFDPRKFITDTMNRMRHEAEDMGAVDTNDKMRCLWDYSLEKLQRVPRYGKFAVQLLEIMAVLSPDGVSENILSAIFCNYDNPMDAVFDDTKPASIFPPSLRLLKIYSLIQNHSRKEYQIHLLLLEHQNDKMRNDRRLEDHVEKVALAMTSLPRNEYVAENQASYFKNLAYIYQSLTENSRKNESLLKDCLEKFETLLPISLKGLLSSSMKSPRPSTIDGSPYKSPYLQEFEPIGYLGGGGFGVVFEAKKKLDEKHYAVKRIRLPDDKNSRDKMMREVKILAQLDHRNIVRYYSSWLENPPVAWIKHNDPLYNDCTHQLSTQVRSVSVDDSSFICFVDQSKTRDLTSYIDVKSEISVCSSISLKKNNEAEEDCYGKKASDSDCLPESYLYIQQELCEKRTLQKWLEGNIDRSSYQITNLVKQIADAVKYIHGKGLVHRDLKPGNIFLAGGDSNFENGEERLIAKIGDFGLARTLVNFPNTVFSKRTSADGCCLEPDALTAYVGTDLYMSPEQKARKPYDSKSDIYSLGIIFFELFTPFSTGMERQKSLSNLRELKFPDEFCENHAKEHSVIEKMVSHDPPKRPNADEIKGGLW